MAYSHGATHRYLLPSVTPLVTGKSMAYEVLLESHQSLDSPPLHGEVWLLGKAYNLPQDKRALIDDVRSRLWFTYRKNFRPIGDTGYTCDSGWGCTLRCGQMMLGQALVLRHLGRDWRWSTNQIDPVYKKILRLFLDSRDSEYSIQMIALQGADFGRSVGHWFGPNNVAQAIKRLAAHDKWSQIAVYVAMDMLVVIDDIKDLCRDTHGVKGSVEVTTFEGDTVPTPTNRSNSFSHSDPFLDQIIDTSPQATPTKKTTGNGRSKTFVNFSHNKTFSRVSRSYEPTLDTSLLNLSMEDIKKQFIDNTKNRDILTTPTECDATPTGFRPLLLFIPLRLGQERFNMEYTEAVKACLSLSQSVGIIGGKPRHALWFIGYHNNYLLYLDPHRTQNSVLIPDDDIDIVDNTYHCHSYETMHIKELDPSLALGFFCKDENDIDNLCRKLRSEVLARMQYMFELTQHRPSYWGPPESNKHTSQEPFILLQPETRSTESDDGFELIDWPYSTPHQPTSQNQK